ncbi:MAG TPA: NADH-quinone oxidoreductase subunit J [Verrucomicrobiota bacterium]|nr:NADH-quinone oxidoreductase subunit J [Verrucomicrobiales bacterium]HRI15390.1 NADH-quinone oxidoreductase subunit J [Verrucomicrobiota bacterium]
MTATFALLAGLTFGAALAAVSLRNLVHSALCLALSLSGLGLIFVYLNAEFAGLVQVLVYVGAVAILIVFAVLLVRGIEPSGESVSRAPILGLGVTLSVAAMLTWAVWQSPLVHRETPSPPKVTVRAIGERLMREYVVPLQALGLLLTVATLGAALIALPRRDPRSTSTRATPS